MTEVKSDNLEYLCDLPLLKKNWIGSIVSGGASGLKQYSSEKAVNKKFNAGGTVWINSSDNIFIKGN